MVAMLFTDEEKKLMLYFARESITQFVKWGNILEVKANEIPNEKFIENSASFVTLNEGGRLRGCIGMLEARRPLIRDIILNSVAASTEDPRFPPVRLDELDDIIISISILTKPIKLFLKNSEDILDKLVVYKHGLIIEKGWARATFLPSVWNEINDKKEFLKHLCLKAGLDKDEWKKNGMDFFVYETIEFSESDF